MCAARSVHVQFNVENMPNTKLVLVGSGLDHGEWSSGLAPPNELVPPATSISWQSESDGFATGTQGWVRYYPISPGATVPANVPDSETIWMTWDDPFVGQNSYNSTAPSPPYNIGGGTILDYNADNDSAVFTLSFTPQLLQSPMAPALAFLPKGPLGSEIAVAYVANNNSDDLLVSTTTSINNWGQSNPVSGQQSNVGPALTTANFTNAPTIANGSLILVYAAANGSGDLLASVSSDGVNWSHSISFANQSTAMSPAVASSSSFAVIAYVANNGSNDLITLAWNGTNTTIEVGANPSGLQSPYPPALAVLNNTFYMVYVANNGSKELFVAKSVDGLSWTNLPPIAGQTSPSAPAVMALGDKLVVAYVANNGSNEIFTTVSTDQGASWSTGKSIGGGQTTQAPAALAQFVGGEAVLAYVSNDTSNRLICCTSFDGETWSSGGNMTSP
jgi:hypothetical protein